MIYLDHAASTPVSEEIQDSFNKVAMKYYANPASVHRFGLEAYELEKKARQQIADLFGVESNEVLFTSGATEANNLAIKGTAFKYKNRGNHLITTKVEHPSVLNAFMQLEEEFGFRVTYLNVDAKGQVDFNELKEAIDNQTILVSIIAVNNEVGAINDIDQIGRYLKQYPKVIFHSDITQAVGKIKQNYQNVDLLSLSAHKLNGFKGSGLLIKKKNIDLLPLLSGGGQELNLRSGTNNLPYEVCLAKALRIAFEKQEEHYQKVLSLNKYLIEKLQHLEETKLNSTEMGSPYIVNFSINKKASVVAEALSLQDIYVSTKSACSSKKSSSSYVLEAMGKSKNEASNAIRISLSYLNQEAELETFIKALEKILKNTR